MRRVVPAVLLLSLAATAHADPALDAEEIEFVRLINEYRASKDLPCISVSVTANVAADWMSREMGEQAFFDHNEPPCEKGVCTGRDPFARMIDLGHTGWGAAGENIAAGYPNAAAVFAGWRSSPGHNANMLHPRFTAMGIARVEVPGSPYGVYWTNDFSDNPADAWDCNEGLPPEGFPLAEDEDDGKTRGGCSAAASAPSLLGVALLALLRRQRGR